MATLNARHDVLGRTIVLDGAPHTIIGVMPTQASGFGDGIAFHWAWEIIPMLLI